jgi:hypothetical protein
MILVWTPLTFLASMLGYENDAMGMMLDNAGEFGGRYGTGIGSDLAPSEVGAYKAPGRYRSLYRTNSPAVSMLRDLGSPEEAVSILQEIAEAHEERIRELARMATGQAKYVAAKIESQVHSPAFADFGTRPHTKLCDIRHT